MEKEENMFGMRVLRKFKGPASHLVSLQDSQNRHFVGIAFYDRYRNHSAITNSLNGLMGFLQSPVAKGITPLYTHDSVRAGFIYETGKVKSVAEMIRQASDLGLRPGPRAGIQLIVEVADILRTAIRIAETYAIFSHGGLTPWRIMVRPDGKLQLIGFAIPQVEVLDFSQNPNNIPSEDSFRYVPPERMSAHSMEDISSDLFSLALIGFEIMTTKPVYDGSASIIQESASRADVSLKLNQALMDGLLDRNTHDFLDRSLRLHPEDRFSSVDEMIREGRRLLSFSQLRGMSLFELVGKTDVQVMRRSQEISQVEEATGMFDRSALQVEEQDKIGQITNKIKQQEAISHIEEVKPELIPEAIDAGSSGANKRKDLLRLLRESQINIPSADSPKPALFQDARTTSLPPNEEKPSNVPKVSDSKASLLSALRESVSSSASVRPKPEEQPIQKTQKKPEQKSKSEDRAPKNSKLSGLISKSGRNSSPRSAEIPKPQISKPRDAAESLKDSLLKSLISKSERDSAPKEEVIPQITPQKRQSQRPVPQKIPQQLEEDPFGGQSFGDPLDELPEDDELDEAATSIMTRPSFQKKKEEPKIEKPIQTKQKISLKPKEEKPVQQAKTTQNKKQELPRPKITIEPQKKEKPPQSQPQNQPRAVGQKVGDVYGVPLILKNNSPANKGDQYMFSIGEGKGVFTLTLPAKATSASVIYRKLLHRVLPIRSDLTGNITSMYRFSRNGEPVSGLEKMGAFNPKRPILLCSVPNTIQLQTFEVWKDEELVRFTAPVGMAIPVYSLLDYLASWLRLEKSVWQLSIGELILEPANILFDVQEQLERQAICLKRKRGA